MAATTANTKNRVAYILAFICGFSKAIRDTISHHFDISIFSTFSKPIREFMQSQWDQAIVLLGFIKIDGWHLADQLSYLSLLLVPMVVGKIESRVFMAMILIAIASFLIFYKLIFIWGCVWLSG